MSDDNTAKPSGERAVAASAVTDFEAAGLQGTIELVQATLANPVPDPDAEIRARERALDEVKDSAIAPKPLNLDTWKAPDESWWKSLKTRMGNGKKKT